MELLSIGALSYQSSTPSTSRYDAVKIKGVETHPRGHTELFPPWVLDRIEIQTHTQLPQTQTSHF